MAEPEPLVIDGADGVYARAQSYEVSVWPDRDCLDANTWKLDVEYAGNGKWAVRQRAGIWMRLALAGNPTILLPLFVPADEIVAITAPGRSLREQRGLILSRQAGHRFAGYLEAQRRGLLSHQGKGRDVTRPELVEAYGWDVKYGAHMIRLGLQGVELLETGWITLPMPEPWRSWIVDLRQGGHSMDEALSVAEDLEGQLRALTESSPLPDRPDYVAADEWLIGAYQSAWAPVVG